LKTLEEPPAHVLFMFATTEAHKIPVTILSRCQRFDFRRVRLASIAEHLAAICRREGVQMDAASLNLIARESGGSVRDSLSLLDQILASGQQAIHHEQVLETLGVIDRSRLQELSEAILAGNAVRFLETLDLIFDRGYDIKKLFADFLDYLRDLWVVQTAQNASKLLDLPVHDIEMLERQAGQASRSDLQHVLDVLYREEAAVRFSSQPRLALEMAFFRILNTRPALPIDTLIAKLDDLRREVHGCAGERSSSTRGSHSPESEPQSSFPSKRDGGQQGKIPKEPVRSDMTRRNGSASAAPIDLEVGWQRIIESISHSHPSLAANLKKCCLRRVNPQRVEVVAPENQFTSLTLRREKNLSLLKKACSDVFGAQTDVAVAVGGECLSSVNERREHHQAVVKEALNHPLIAEAIEIFNGKLLDVQILKEGDE
jgi:DNA polymerase-3 subunit gamma/tau